MLARGVSPSQRVRKLLFDRDRSPLSSVPDGMVISSRNASHPFPPGESDLDAGRPLAANVDRARRGLSRFGCTTR